MIRMSNKIWTVFTVIMTVLAVTPPVQAATQVQTNPSVEVTNFISIDCTDYAGGDEYVDMGDISGTGQSVNSSNSNTAKCIVKTNEDAGYTLNWDAAAATMAGSPSGTIDAFTPGGTDPITWSVATTASEWGAKLGQASTSKGLAIDWGSDDTYTSGKWFNVSTSGKDIATRTTETDWTGDSEYIVFGAEVGSGVSQPVGQYTVAITFTVTTN